MPDRYLALIPEQGGACFGPFATGTLCLGTDNRTCAVVLGASPDLRPIHAQITLAPDGRAFLQAGDRAARIWVYARGGVAPLDGSASLQLGDAFSLGSPQGPRFVLCDVPPLQQLRAPPPPPPPGAGGVTSHRRRDEAFQAKKASGIGAIREEAATGVARVREESKTNPLYVAVAVLGVLAIFASTCAGLGVAVFGWLGG